MAQAQAAKQAAEEREVLVEEEERKRPEVQVEVVDHATLNSTYPEIEYRLNGELIETS